METKCKKEKFEEAARLLEDSWVMIHNRSIEDYDSDTIWIGWRKSTRTGTIIDTHKQWMHVKLINNGG